MRDDQVRQFQESADMVSWPGSCVRGRQCQVGRPVQLIFRLFDGLFDSQIHTRNSAAERVARCL